MGAIMVGVVMAGRTGAAFAAQLGTMQVNEEIDAFHTMSVSPVDFLVVPRMLGLTLMMPFLCIYADLMGTLGGLFVGVTMLDLGAAQYYIETKSAVGVNDLIIGVTTCTVYGVLISFSGCYRGMRCGRSSADVGEATTASVVTSVVMMVVATAIITVICDILGV
jgi:phospholipid/cholesterol/gamma-HCH transport system permease protein